MKVLLAVGGGIAAYKSAELARLLMQQGHQVQVVMTSAAEEFVRPLTFAALTGRKVLTNLFAIENAIEHISVAQEHELLVIAPATADLMAKLAHGLADDFLTTLYLAFTGPVVIAPAMNVNMWQHPATQANLATLVKRGHTIVEPGSGYLACGMTGPGRLADPEAIAAAIERAASRRRDLEGETVLITAGPTQEPLDPVRYISNRSSGKMGYALAEAAAARGARVILVSGPVHLAPPRRCGSRAGAHRSGNARSGDGASSCRRHRDQGGRRGRFPPQQGPGSEGQEDCRAGFAGTRPHPGHPGGTGAQEGRFPAGRVSPQKRRICCRKRAANWNPRTATWWSAILWAAPISASNPTRTKWCSRCVPVNPLRCPAPLSAPSPTVFSMKS